MQLFIIIVKFTSLFINLIVYDISSIIQMIFTYVVKKTKAKYFKYLFLLFVIHISIESISVQKKKAS